MSPRKLTEDDKQEILQLYRNSEATTSTLAMQYEVSSSTISRFLKNKLSSTEYEDLIQQKRLARTPRGEKSAESDADLSSPKTSQKSDSQDNSNFSDNQVALVDIVAVNREQPSETEPVIPPTRRRRRRNTASLETEESISIIPATDTATEIQPEPPEQLVIRTKASALPSTSTPSKNNSLILKSDRLNLEEEEDDEVNLITLKEMLGEDLEDINEDDDDDWDDDDEEEDDEDDDEIVYASGINSTISDLEILPLSEAVFPRTCYLVIDRAAELIVKPLADFADLGMIPQAEIKETTLPVFDNHRIAKRFSHRRERVIKVPDGRMLQKTSRYLQDKGITRLLIDGQIYSLSS